MMEFQYDLCVIGGAGHIGLPFALVSAKKGLNVAVYDINRAALEMIGKGKVPFMEEGAEIILAELLNSKKITISCNPDVITSSRTIVITIGTPVDEFTNPEFNKIQELFLNLLPFINNEQLLILRSTVYPGTTVWLADFLKSKGRTPLISFCPERVVQGKAIAEILDLPQIVSGITPEAEEAAEKFFNILGVEIVRPVTHGSGICQIIFQCLSLYSFCHCEPILYDLQYGRRGLRASIKGCKIQLPTSRRSDRCRICRRAMFIQGHNAIELIFKERIFIRPSCNECQ